MITSCIINTVYLLLLNFNCKTQTTMTKKLASICIISCICSISKTFAVTARTLNKTKDSANHDRSQIDGSRSILDMISLVNDYLWFAIWFVCFLFMIWNWYKLITASWDEKAMGSATKALLWSGIWIAICLLAYIIVNIAINLFA